ncbi:MAG TPA: 4-hydroxy-tetrahydrodipicolinate synthase [Chitinophagales bacterium]|nr:4-hydroxy-tetrahydrodipicolinate synthase [Chitinophagales bacterium]
MTPKFRGTGVALITPFKKDGFVDYGALEKLIRFNIEGGVNYFVVLGTTGESATLSSNDKRDVWKFVAGIVDEEVHLVAGIGGNNTAEVAEQFTAFNHEHYDAILSVSPYYNKPSQEGIYQHYMQLARISPLPIIIYNVPGRTSSNITAETTLRLAHESPRFVGIKEASGNIGQIMRIVKERPKNFLLISGDDLITLPLLSFGCDGVISVVAQAFPKDFSTMVDDALDGNFDDAQKLHYKLLDFMESFFAEGSPGGVKAALNILGICENVLRLPMVPVSSGLYEKIKLGMKNN